MRLRILEINTKVIRTKVWRRPDIGRIPEFPCGRIPKLVLMQCLPKGRKMDTIVRQASEAGVSRIVPLFSDHSLIAAARGFTEKISRWKRIAREALQQSGRMFLPAIDEPRELADVCSHDNKMQKHDRMNIRPKSIFSIFTFSRAPCALSLVPIPHHL